MVNFQYRIQKLLELENYDAVFPVRDANSLVDLIAVRNGKVSAFRAKAHGKIYSAEHQKLADLAKKSGMKVVIVKEGGDRGIHFREVI